MDGTSNTHIIKLWLRPTPIRSYSTKNQIDKRHDTASVIILFFHKIETRILHVYYMLIRYTSTHFCLGQWTLKATGHLSLKLKFDIQFILGFGLNSSKDGKALHPKYNVFEEHSGYRRSCRAVYVTTCLPD